MATKSPSNVGAWHPQCRYVRQEELDEDIDSGSTSWNDEAFDQLDELLGSTTNME
jgi:hypothetical protein